MENEKLKYLTTYLLSEHSEWNDLVFPTNESEQFHLYRSLVNIRPAGKASAEYLKAEDEFLRGLTAQKGITSVADLQPLRSISISGKAISPHCNAVQLSMLRIRE